MNLKQEIKQLIKEEEDCMRNDEYPEQELEHVNQIEMAGKILKLVDVKVKGLKENIDKLGVKFPKGTIDLIGVDLVKYEINRIFGELE